MGSSGVSHSQHSCSLLGLFAPEQVALAEKSEVQMNRNHEVTRRGGFSLVEIAITLAIVAVAIAIAVPSMNRASQNGNLRDGALALDGGLTGTRGEAIRTGDVHLFFVFQDAEGNALVDQNGDSVPALMLNDGPPGSPGQNCRIDAGETVKALNKADLAGMIGGPPGGNTPGGDLGMGGTAGGSSFVDPAGNPATWVMFRPEGMPVAFDSNCNLGAAGSGAGAFYMKNADRAYVVMLSPMGTTRIEAFNHTTGGWE